MPDIQQILYDFDATVKAHPEYTDSELLKKFPEFGNDKKKLQSAHDYSATFNSGKYKDVSEVNSKFPEFFGNKTSGKPVSSVSANQNPAGKVDWGSSGFTPTPPPQDAQPGKGTKTRGMYFPPLDGNYAPVTMNAPAPAKTTVSVGNRNTGNLIQPFGQGKPLAETAGEQVANIQLPADKELNASMYGWMDSKGQTLDSYKGQKVTADEMRRLEFIPEAKEWLDANKVEDASRKYEFVEGSATPVENTDIPKINTPEQYAALRDFYLNSPTGQQRSKHLEDKRKSLVSELESISPEAEKISKQLSDKGQAYIISNPSSIPVMRPNEGTLNAKDLAMQRAVSFINEAKKRISSATDGGGFWKGVSHDSNDWLRLLAPGVDMAQDVVINNLVDKYQKNPKSLTKDEKFILNAKRLSDEVSGYFYPGSWYNIGQSTKQSLPFMRDFMLTEGIGSGVAGAAKSGISRSLIRSGARGLAERIFSPSAVSNASRAGLGLVDLTVQPTVQTALGASSYGMTAQSMSGQGSTDANGNMQFENRESLPSATFGTWVQNHSELFGTVVLDKLFAKMNLLPKLLTTPTARRIAERTGIASPLGEYAEEKESDAIDVARGKQTVADFFDPRKNLETFGAVAVMQVPFTAIQSAGYAIGKHNEKKITGAVNSAYAAADKGLDIFGNEKQGIISYIDNALADENPMTINASLAEMMGRQDLSSEKKQAIKDYAVARAAKQGLDNFQNGMPEQPASAAADNVKSQLVSGSVDPSIPEGIDPNNTDHHIAARMQSADLENNMQSALEGTGVNTGKITELFDMPAADQEDALTGMLDDSELTDAQKQSVLDYVKSVNTIRKMNLAHEESVNAGLENSTQEIMSAVNPQTGMVQTGKVAGVDAPVQLRGALSVVTDPTNAENPHSIDAANSSGTVAYVNENGEIVPIPVEDVEQVMGNDDPQTLVEQMRAQVAAAEEGFQAAVSSQQLAVNSEQPTVNSQFQAGDEGVLADGRVTAIQNVRPDGTYVVMIENPQSGEITSAEVPAAEIGNYGFGEVDAAPEEVQPLVAGQNPSPVPVEREEDQTSPFPITKEGEIDYEQITDPKMYLDALTQEFGEDVPEILAAKKQEAEAELAEAGKEKDIIQRKRAEKKAKEKIAFWDGMAGLLNDVTPASENVTEPQGEAVAPVEQSSKAVSLDKYPRLVEPSKPVSEMNSEELLQLSDKNMSALKSQDKAFEGKTEEEKRAGGYYDVLDDVGDLRDTAMRVNFVENSEDMDGLVKSARSTLREVKGVPNEYQQAVMNAVGRKSNELGATPQELVEKLAESVASEYSDLEDAKFMVGNMLGKITSPPAPLHNERGAADAQMRNAGIDAQIAEQEPNTSPTEGQKEAGNYKKAHVSVNGMDISIENPVGSVRSGTDEDGKAWEHEMKSHYGYFTRTTGKDGDHIDVFVKEGTPENWNGTVFVVDQVNPSTGAFDESKVMLGYDTAEKAKAAYMENYDPDWKGFSSITPVDVEAFKQWLYDGKRQRKAFAEYVGTPGAVDVGDRITELQDNSQKKQKITPFQKRLALIFPFVEESIDPMDKLLYGLASGRIKMKWSDDPGSKGLASHLGLSGSETERRKRISLLRKDGYTPEQLAHALWEDMGGYSSGMDDSEILNTVLDTLQSIQSTTAAMEQLEKRYQDADADMDKYYAEQEASMVRLQAKAELEAKKHPVMRLIDRLKKSGIAKDVVVDEVKMREYLDGHFEKNVADRFMSAWHQSTRGGLTKVRGGVWTKEKIVKELKKIKRENSGTNDKRLIEYISEFDSPSELRDHLFYHGTGNYVSGNLYPSMTMSERDAERYGGVGYGDRYYSVSISRDKNIAKNFSGQSRGVSIYPVLLNKNAKIIEMPNIQDSAELEDHIEQLWNEGVDGVWIGDKDSGEKELSILNPLAISVFNLSKEYHNVFGIGKLENPTDEKLQKTIDNARKYVIETDNFVKENFTPLSEKEKLSPEERKKVNEQYRSKYNEFKYQLLKENPIRLMSTPAGEVYGFTTPDGVVYLDPNRMNANTPIHEFGHLWWNVMPEELKGEITELVKQTPEWEKVSNNPADDYLKTDEQKADEVFNTILGNRGENAIAVREIMGEDISLIARISNAMNKIWNWLKSVVGNKEAKVNRIADMTLGELIASPSPSQGGDVAGAQKRNSGEGLRMQQDSYMSTRQEVSDMQYEKAKTLLDALKNAGLDGFSISRSVTDFGASTYVQGPYNLKFRISDHSVTSTKRILSEIFFNYNSDIDSLVEYAKEIKSDYEKLYAKREKAADEYKVREENANAKWERVKDNFQGFVFKKNNRTYQNFETLSKAGQYPRSNIYQKQIGGGAFKYEWAESTEYDKWGHPTNYGEQKPSMEYIEAFDEGTGDMNTTRFQIIVGQGASSSYNPLDTYLVRYFEKGSSVDDKNLLKHYGLKRFSIQNKNGFAVLSLIQSNEYGKGSGTKLMNDLTNWADKNKISIALTPDTSFGATSKSRLETFYKRFGFKKNTGGKRDFSIMESMIRTPQRVERSLAEKQNIGSIDEFDFKDEDITEAKKKCLNK